jgi:adenylyl-sulfate kinase
MIHKEILPAVFWFTGLSGSGKTTLADALAHKLRMTGVYPILLDGDTIRKRKNNNRFDAQSRMQHNLQVGEIASALEKQGRLVIVSLISPYAAIRDDVRRMCTHFIEVYIEAPITVCIERDRKGFYEKALKGEIANFTGIDAPYEIPPHPELRINTAQLNIEQSANTIFNYYLRLRKGTNKKFASTKKRMI